MYIEVKDAVKKYGTGESELYALNHVSLTLEKGEICVILGPSGSGKSTLLNMLGGMDHLDAGSITIDGQEITKLSRKALGEYRRKKIGVVFQSYNLDPGADSPGKYPCSRGYLSKSAVAFRTAGKAGSDRSCHTFSV